MKKVLVAVILLGILIVGGFYFFSAPDEKPDDAAASPKLNAQELMQRKSTAMRRHEKREAPKQEEVQPVANPDTGGNDDQKSKDTMAMRDGCVMNLKTIEDAKTKWAIANNKAGGDKVSLNDISSYLPNSAMPPCPGGGVYSLNEVGIPATCSIAGHVLPAQ